MQIITTHNIADFDGIASMLAAHKLYPSAVPVLPPRLGRGVKEFISLYQSALPFVKWRDFKSRRYIEQIILVDTQKAPDFKRVRPNAPILVIDHHPIQSDLPPNVTITGDLVGSNVTLLVEQIQQHPEIKFNSLEATLLLLGIYSDTGALTYGTTTARDAYAAGWVLAQNASVDTVRKFLAPPLNDSQRDLFDLLIQAEETRNIQGYNITVGAVALDHYVESINSIAHRLRDMLDPDALFLLVQMPDNSGRRNIQIVCRAKTDAIDCGQIAGYFGGGGHGRAAAANIEAPLDETTKKIWEVLAESIKPPVLVADLMSYGGSQIVSPDSDLREIIVNLRKIGHEGYPVLDENHHVIGLLTRRDADRALEHGLKDVTVRDVMSSGEITLKPSDSVATLERLMVDSGWGQIPVVDDERRMIGIVTRTDLIKHWVTVHPSATDIQPDNAIISSELGAILGDGIAKLIDLVANFARGKQLHLYMVGGVVRDILLNRHNDDIDFVIEASPNSDNPLEHGAIAFAQAISHQYGGKISSYQPFGTATWYLDETVAQALSVSVDDLPDVIDFATARNEFYVHPTALPSVYGGSIKLDLLRRDFTINTLAVQLSPNIDYHILDFYGGQRDLKEQTIRVLHSLSFVDDPTRVLRAVRFEHRLKFKIEPRTLQLMHQAQPMLRRITGERLRHELKNLLDEQNPEEAFLILDERGILTGIHPELNFKPEMAQAFINARETRNQWLIHPDKIRHIYWVLLMSNLDEASLDEISQRLRFSQTFVKNFKQASDLHAHPAPLNDPDAPISAIVRRLDGVRDLALLATWITSDPPQRQRIESYITTWSHIRPKTNGHALKSEFGLSPSPRFALILGKLRDAWLDGDVTSPEQEIALLHQLIEETQA
jgi:tRNA nucleotidyltransferase (CCA-adding enzyme)